jgi:hypothetical protein
MKIPTAAKTATLAGFEMILRIMYSSLFYGLLAYNAFRFVGYALFPAPPFRIAALIG